MSEVNNKDTEEVVSVSEEKEEIKEEVSSEEKKTEPVEEKKPEAEDKSETDKEKKEETKPDNNKEETSETIDDSEIVDVEKAAAEEEKKSNSTLVPVKKKHDGKRKLSKSQKKVIKTIVIIVVIIGLIAAGVLKVRKSMKEGMEALRQQMSANLTPSQVERRDLTENISVTGKIRSNETRTQITNLVSQSAQSAKILTVNVEVGDYVNEGDVLVTFSTEDLEKEIARTQEDLSRQRKLDSLDEANNQRSYVYSYQQAADTLQDNAKSTDRALQSLYEACDAYGDAKRELQDAKDKLEEARTANDVAKITQLESQITQLESAVASAKSAEERAQQNYDDAVIRESSSLSSAQGVPAVQNNLSTADYNYQKSIIQSGERAQTYSRTLQDSKDKLEDYVVTASMSGLVTSVKVAEGNSFSSGEVLTIQDVSTLKVDAEIDEYDIWKVKEGMRVIVKTEATGDDEFAGVVSLVHPTATTAASASAAAGGTSTPTYTVTVDLLEKDERLMLGMTAKMSIIVDEKQNVMCVSYDAIGQNADGDKVVYVLDDMSLLERQKDKDTAKNAGGLMGTFRADGSAFGFINPAYDDNSGKKSGRSGKKDKKDKKPDSSTDILVENDISGTETKVSKKPDAQEPASEEDMYHELVVETGMETDYYTEIITDKLKEGDYIVIKSEDSGNDLLMMMMGGMPPG